MPELTPYIKEFNKYTQTITLIVDFNNTYNNLMIFFFHHNYKRKHIEQLTCL